MRASLGTSKTNVHDYTHTHIHNVIKKPLFDHIPARVMLQFLFSLRRLVRFSVYTRNCPFGFDRIKNAVRIPNPIYIYIYIIIFNSVSILYSAALAVVERR